MRHDHESAMMERYRSDRIQRLVVFVLTVSLMSCSISYQLGKPGGSPQTISLIRLIADGSKYDGKEVWVVGVLRAEHEGSSLYLSTEHSEHGFWEYALSLSFDFDALGADLAKLEELNGRYVYVQGIFRTQSDPEIWRNGRIERVVQIRSID